MISCRRTGDFHFIGQALSAPRNIHKDYCAEHGISRDAYFYWLRKIRESAVASASEQFAELLPPAEPPAAAGSTTGVTIEMNGVMIRVEDACSRNALTMVLEVLRNAQ